MTMTQDERISRLEGAFEAFSIMVANMVTKDELRAYFDGHREATQAAIEGLRAETVAAIAGLRSEMLASDESLRNEMEAKIRASELRLIRWMIATAFAGATLIIGSISAILFAAIRFMT